MIEEIISKTYRVYIIKMRIKYILWGRIDIIEYKPTLLVYIKVKYDENY